MEEQEIITKETKSSTEKKYRRCEEGAFAIGENEENDKPEEKEEEKERISKRRENVMKLLEKFNGEAAKLKSPISTIVAELTANEKTIKGNIKQLETVRDELNRRKEQLEAIAEISETYIDFVCEKFDVEKDQIIKIRESKN